jgi:dolichol-phosphate mannosyltransferase
LTDDRQHALLVLICTYNERQNLPDLFAQIEQALPGAHLLVVDDNSPDGTSQWVEDYARSHANVHLITRSGKLGLGTAIRDGMYYAIDQGYEWLVNLDADLSHDPAVIPTMIELSGDSDLVIGSRYVAGGGTVGCSWRRVLTSRCANIYARWLLGWSVSDCSTSYRLYRVEYLKRIELSKLVGVGYGFLEEILWHLLDEGARFRETAITYTERRKGKSKISAKEALSAISALHRVARLRKF